MVEDAVAAGDPVAALTLAGVADGLAAPLLDGTSLAEAGLSLGAELARIALGQSQVTPKRSDWRFKDPTWSGNPLYQRLAQTYLASCQAVDSVLEDVERSGARHRAERARFVMGILTSAEAPTNMLMGNPGALKNTFEAGGANLVHGVQNFLHDLRHNGGMPSVGNVSRASAHETQPVSGPGFVRAKRMR